VKEIYKMTLFILAFILISCGGGGGVKLSRFSKPTWITSTEDSIRIDGVSTKVVYVSNSLGGDIVPIDTERRRVIDTDLFNTELTPIAVAGDLSQIIVKKSLIEGSSVDIYAASKNKRAIYLIRAASQGGESDLFLSHSTVDIGSTTVCGSSNPLFEDKGPTSNPSIGGIQMTEGLTKTENWMVQYSSTLKGYSVTGSLSGLQTGLALENTAYTSDDGSISFIIYNGSKDTTNKDNFTFGTNCSKPLSLNGEPSGFLFSNSKLFAALEDLSTISVFNEEDFLSLSDITLNDSSGDAFKPNALVELNGKIYVSNSNGSTIAEIDPISYAVNYYSVGESTSFLASNSGITDKLYLLPSQSRKLLAFSLSSFSVDGSLDLSDIPRSFLGIPDDSAGIKRAIVPNVTNSINVVDLSNFKLIDQIDRSGLESSATSPRFSDVLPVSAPKLLDVTTYDGITKSERWVLIFNGAIPNSYSENGAVVGVNFSDTLAQFGTYGIIAGDVLVINPFDSAKEEVTISAITDDNNLILEKPPVAIGSNIEYQIRSNNNYVVYGSLSGLQKNRLFEGVPYTSDATLLSMNVVPSLNAPTTEGDYFTFLTNDGIDSISLRSKNLPYHSTLVVKQSDSKEYIYLSNEGSNNISVIDVSSLKEIATID